MMALCILMMMMMMIIVIVIVMSCCHVVKLWFESGSIRI